MKRTRWLVRVGPLGMLMLLVSPLGAEEVQQADGYFEFNTGEEARGDESWVQAIRVVEPAPRSEVEGEVMVRFRAEGMTSATAFCWQQPEDPVQVPPAGWGSDVNLTPDGIDLDPDGLGSFVFPADQFPNGPINVRIYAHNGSDRKDIYELQLFNRGGVKWNQGIPKPDPPAAEGLQLIFADDFDGPLSITNDGKGARYHAHKPGGGDFSGWQFSNVLGEGKPFGLAGTWLRIAARKDGESPQGRSGLVASVDRDFDGLWAQAPCYFECRFTAQSAIGTWPAFWTLAYGDGGSDELDIVEAYGGLGKGNPNHPSYSIVSHFWNQFEPDGSKKEARHTRPPMMTLGGKSYWSTTFHTYAVRVGLTDTVYYFDDIEVLRHPTNKVSRENPHFFLVNLAIGGISGWPIDLERYGNGSDMWIDYIRVYAAQPVAEGYRPNFDPVPVLKTAGVGLSFAVEGDEATVLLPEAIAGAAHTTQAHWNNMPGPAGESEKVTDDQGALVEGMRAEWSVPGEDQKWRSQKGRDWGFKGGNRALTQGYLQLGGRLALSGIPYPKYDLYVYLGAGDLSGWGSVTVSSAEGDTDPRGTLYYKLGWLHGKYAVSEATTMEAAENTNAVVFRNNTAEALTLEWIGDQGQGWTGVSGVQVVEVP